MIRATPGLDRMTTGGPVAVAEPRRARMGATAEPAGDGTPHRWRVAIYSHDTMGLGHLRRNQLVAQALACSTVRVDILLIVGTREGAATRMPPGVDCLTLPALRKDEAGNYAARRLRLTLPEIIALRSSTIAAALASFQPDVFIVDNVPRGAARELDAALAWARASGHTRCVLGMREVLDEPATVWREWRRSATTETLRAVYDAIWVYGDPAVYDPAREYALAPDLAAKVRHVGYLDQRRRQSLAAVASPDAPAVGALPDAPFALCLVGGGQDGARLAEAFARAPRPAGLHGVILTGPFMPPAAQRRLLRRAAAEPGLHVLTFVDEPAPLLERAERIVAMGGYNTVCEVLSYEKRALIVPRVKPRREQLIRAERLRDLGVVDLLHPEALSPAAVGDWLAQAGPAPRVHDRIDMGGFERLPDLLREVLPARVTPPWPATRQEEAQYVAH